MSPSTTKYQTFAEADLDELLGRLTTDEKVDLIAGASWWTTSRIPRLGVPVSDAFLPTIKHSGRVHE
jgi:hypothetical protein